MFIRWNSTMPQQAGEVPIITLPAGDLGLADEHFQLFVADGELQAQFDPADAVAAAVADAIRFNADNVRRLLAEGEVNGN